MIFFSHLLYLIGNKLVSCAQCKTVSPLSAHTSQSKYCVSVIKFVLCSQQVPLREHSNNCKNGNKVWPTKSPPLFTQAYYTWCAKIRFTEAVKSLTLIIFPSRSLFYFQQLQAIFISQLLWHYCLLSIYIEAYKKLNSCLTNT
jgi:hypothetical protein